MIDDFRKLFLESVVGACSALRSQIRRTVSYTYQKLWILYLPEVVDFDPALHNGYTRFSPSALHLPHLRRV